MAKKKILKKFKGNPAPTYQIRVDADTTWKSVLETAPVGDGTDSDTAYNLVNFRMKKQIHKKRINSTVYTKTCEIKYKENGEYDSGESTITYTPSEPFGWNAGDDLTILELYENDYLSKAKIPVGILDLTQPLVKSDAEYYHGNDSLFLGESSVGASATTTTTPSWMIIKDSYGSNTYSVDYNGTAHGPGAPTFDQRRIDQNGTAYFSTGTNWPNLSGTSQKTEPEYNLTNLQSSNSGLYSARAIRFKCKRPNSGAGYFAIWKFGMLKGASGHNGAFRNMTSSYRDAIGTYMETQGRAGKTWGFNAVGWNSALQPGDKFGTSLFPSGKDVWTCASLTPGDTDCGWTGDINDPQDRGIAFFKETDPLNQGVPSKTDDSTWIRTQCLSGLNLEDNNHSERSFGDVVNGIFAPFHENYRPSFGIKGGEGWPAEVYFTFFFAESINITNLEGIIYNPVSDQAGSEVSIEFLMT